MPEFTTSERFLYVVKSVLQTPFSWAIWALGGVVSYVMKSPLPMGFAIVAQAGLIINYLNNEAYLEKIFQERQLRDETLSEQQIETLLERMDFETRQRIRYILQLQKEMAREARTDDVENYAKKDLERIASKLNPLVQQALRLAERKQKLIRYLQNVDERALRTYCANVKQRIESTDDPVQKAQFEQALRAREAELQTYQSIAQAAGRIDSQLENVEATFASWKAKVIRIKTADVSSAASVSEGLYQELDAMSNEIDLIDTSVNEVLGGEEQVTLKQQ